MLDEIIQHPVIYFIAWTLPWLFFSWLRMQRYMRYFQSEGYKRDRYNRWLSQNSAEQRYYWFSAVLSFMLVSVVLVSLITFRLTALWSAIFYVGFALLAFSLRPRDHGNRMPRIVTYRALRLIVTACLIETLPVIIAAFALWLFNERVNTEAFSPAIGFAILIIFGLPAFLLSLIAGPASYLFAPHALPLANLINWPIDRLLFVPRNTSTSQGSSLQ